MTVDFRKVFGIWPIAGMLVLSLGIMGCSPMGTVPPQHQLVNADSDSLGKRLYVDNCASCHGVTGHGNPMMLRGKDVRFDDPAWQNMFTDGQIVYTIKAGRGMMPAFEGMFTETEMTELVQYIRSLPEQQ